jgi:hypothetical protein
MKKTAIITLAIFGLIFILALAVNFLLPVLVSVDDYKAEIATKFEEETGYEIEFGDINLSLLPSLHASAADVRISNNAKVLAEIGEVNAYADIWELLQGNFKVGSVDVDSPRIYIEKYKVGTNWDKKDKLNSVSPEIASSSLPTTDFANDFSINRINISNGEFRYDDNIGRKNYSITKLNFSSSLQSLQNPIPISGNFEFLENNFSVEAKISSTNSEVTFSGMDTEINFIGNQDKGDFKISSADINKITAILTAENPNLPKPNFVADGNFIIGESSNLFEMKNFQLGDSKGEGKIGIDSEGKITADVKMKKLVIEDLLSEDLATKNNADNFSSQKSASKPLLNNLALRLSLRSEKLNYKQLNLSDLDLQIAAENGELILQPLSFNFENGGSFEVFGVYDEPTAAKKVFEGKIQASGKDLHKLLRDYGTDVSAIKTDQLKDFALNTSIFINFDEQKNIDLSSMQISIDDSNFSGATQITLNKIPDVTIRGSLGNLNLDKLFVEKAAPTTSQDIKTQAKDRRTLNFNWLKNLPANINLALIVDEIISGEELFKEVKFTAIAKKEELLIENFSFYALDTDLNGNLLLNVKEERPKISTNVNIGFIRLEPKTQDGEVKPIVKKDFSDVSTRWSQEPLNFSPLDEIDGNFTIQIAALQQGNLRLDKINIKGNMLNAQVNITDSKAFAFRGVLSTTGAIGVGLVPSLSLKFFGENMDMSQLASQLANNNKLAGIMNVNGDLISSGGNELALVQNLKGAVGFAGTNLIVYSFDLESFVNRLTNINNPLEVGVMAAKVLSGEGQTLITSLRGNFGIDKGVANTAGLQLLTRVGEGTFKGDINLPKWEMDTNAYFAIDLGDAKERPKVGARMYGPIDKFKKDFDYSEIVAYYSARFGLTDRLGNILNKALTSDQ